MASNHRIIEEACNAIGYGRIAEARDIVGTKYPFYAVNSAGRQYSDYQKTRIFLRDGFVDRYSGEKMVFPPVLRVLSILMPEEFPFHKNWKMSGCHLAYWQLLPTVDHIIPVSRGGADDETNWVCTSQLRNSAKSNWLLAELGWQLYKPGNLSEWDGLVKWFMAYAIENPRILEVSYIRSWHNAASRAMQHNREVRGFYNSPQSATTTTSGSAQGGS